MVRLVIVDQVDPVLLVVRIGVEVLPPTDLLAVLPQLDAKLTGAVLDTLGEVGGEALLGLEVVGVPPGQNVTIGGRTGAW